MVDGSVRLAIIFGVSAVVVGLTVVAVGTSLPELAVSAVASFRGETDISMGNIIGSNVFNILMVAGVASAAGTILIEKALMNQFAIMILVSCLIVPMIWRGHTLGRKEGAAMLAGYAIYIYYLYAAGISMA